MGDGSMCVYWLKRDEQQVNTEQLNIHRYLYTTMSMKVQLHRRSNAISIYVVCTNSEFSSLYLAFAFQYRCHPENFNMSNSMNARICEQ